MKFTHKVCYDVEAANVIIPFFERRGREINESGDSRPFRDYSYHEPCKWSVYNILVSLIVAQSTVTIILKFIIGILIINHQVSSWRIFNRFLEGEIELPNLKAQLDVTISVGFFTAVGVLTGFLMLWDMIIETLEEFKRAGCMEGKRIQPYYELWIILIFEEIPQAIIRLYVLIHYSVTDPSPSWLTLIYSWETLVIRDVIAVFIRFFSAISRLYSACQPAIHHFQAIGHKNPSVNEADFATKRLIRQISRIKKELPSTNTTCWQKTVILLAVITDILLMISLLGLTIAYVILKSRLGKK